MSNYLSYLRKFTIYRFSITQYVHFVTKAIDVHIILSIFLAQCVYFMGFIQISISQHDQRSDTSSTGSKVSVVRYRRGTLHENLGWRGSAIQEKFRTPLPYYYKARGM